MRIVRLYPVLFIGAALGVLSIPSIEAGGIDGIFVPYHFSRSCAVISQFALVPLICGGAQLFILNGPYWSILYELIANLAHGLLVAALKTRYILGLILFFAACLLVKVDSDGLDVGWERAHLGIGLLRVGFDYLVGVFLFRTEAVWAPRVPRIPLALVGIVLMAVLLVPDPPAHVHVRGRDLLTIFLIVPPIVASASQWGRDTIVARWLGALSYPLYAIHVPCLAIATWLIGLAAISHRATIMMHILSLGLILAFALALGLWLDRPINRWRRTMQSALASRRNGIGSSPVSPLPHFCAREGDGR